MRARTVTAVAKADCRESTRGGEGCVQVAVTRRPCSVERWHDIATAWRGAYTEAMQCDSPTASAQKEEEGGGCSGKEQAGPQERLGKLLRENTNRVGSSM